MKLKLLRLDAEVRLSEGCPATLEIQDRVVFTRVVRSLMSEREKYAEEPYLIISDDGNVMPAKKSLMIVCSLPTLPLNDRTIMNRLYQSVNRQMENDFQVYSKVQELALSLHEEMEQITSGLWGDYSFAREWGFDSYLKAFSFAPLAGEDYSLLDNCIRFLGLCADAGLNEPIVLVNAKSFFEKKELEDLFEQAFFLNTKLLLIESWKDNRDIFRENKTTVDQHFLVD